MFILFATEIKTKLTDSVWFYAIESIDNMEVSTIVTSCGTIIFGYLNNKYTNIIS